MDTYCMRADRADVILPAGLVLSEVMSKVVGARGLYAANVGLKDGVLVEMVDRFRHSFFLIGERVTSSLSCKAFSTEQLV